MAFTKFPWYAVRTKSNLERVAAGILEGKGYEIYYPVYRTRSRWSDRVVQTERPLFPGYLFCRFDALQRLPVLTTSGVISILGVGQQPMPVSDSEVDAVRRVLYSGLAAGPHPFLREGQRIQITRGCLAGLEGILIEKKSEWRLVVSVTMLQRSVSVEIERDWVSGS
jgi:transcription antitermination factor NusG